MKHKIVCILLLSVTYMITYAQPVIQAQKVLGGSAYDELHSAYPTRDGGLIAGGSSYSNKSGEKTQNIRGFNDYWIVKLNKAGKIEWDKTIGGNGNDNFKAVIQTTDGGYALIGESNSNISVEKSEDSRGNLDYWLVKLDSLGNIEWDKTIGGSGTELIDNIKQTSDGGFILAGSSDSFASGEKTENSRGGLDIWVVKLNRFGNKVWDKTMGGFEYDLASGVQITKDGGLIIGGFSGSGKSGEKSEDNRGIQSDCWIIKLDKNGNIQWDKTIGGNMDDLCRGIQETSDGGYIAAGNSNSNISGEKSGNSRGGYDFWVIKLDSMGRFEKDKTIGGSGDDNDVWCLEKASDSGFIFGGSSASGISGEKTESSRGGFDYWIIKLDKSGNIQWDKTLGGYEYDALLSVKEISPKHYAAGGFSYSPLSGDRTTDSRGSADYWIVELNDQAKALQKAVTESDAVHGLSAYDQLTVYPNPATDVLNIRVNGNAYIKLSDGAGKTIINRKIAGNTAVNVSNLANGIYYLKSDTGNKVQTIVIAR